MTTLFYTKISRVSWVRAITDTGTGDEKRIGEVPTLKYFLMAIKYYVTQATTQQQPNV